jgi:signal transduction histidine kinase
MADPEMLLQLLLNLLLNSLQASSPGARLQLSFTRSGARGRLEVRDQGCGIAPELLPEVLKPYVSGRAEGHGLGLAIVRRMAEQHGWTIEVFSGPDRGTRVLISGLRVVTTAAGAP